MSSSAITTQVAQLKISSIQNQADSSGVYSAGVWSFKNSTAVASVTISDAGNVGIGTASPAYKLDVASGYVRIGRGIAYNASASVGIDLGATNADSVNNSATYAWGQEVTGDANGQALLFKRYRRDNTTVEAMRIDASGNVGIGTASPAVKMHVVGSASVYSKVESTTSSDVAFNAKNSIYESYFGVDNQGGYVSSGNNRPIYFYTSGLSRFIIQSNGTLISLPTYNNTSGTAANMAVSATGEFIRSTSALKYKEDITPISFGLQAVLSMQPIEYKSKCEADKDASHKFIGFVADWEEANLPALVQKNGEGDVEGFSYDRLTAVLCKAIQEQQAQIESLKAEVAALKAP